MRGRLLMTVAAIVAVCGLQASEVAAYPPTASRTFTVAGNNGICTIAIDATAERFALLDATLFGSISATTSISCDHGIGGYIRVEPASINPASTTASTAAASDAHSGNDFCGWSGSSADSPCRSGSSARRRTRPSPRPNWRPESLCPGPS